VEPWWIFLQEASFRKMGTNNSSFRRWFMPYTTWKLAEGISSKILGTNSRNQAL